MKFYRFEVSRVFHPEKLQSSVDTIHFRGLLTSWDLRYHFEEKKSFRVKKYENDLLPFVYKNVLTTFIIFSYYSYE